MSQLDVHCIVGDSHTAANCYLVGDPNGDTLVIDPGCNIEAITDHVSALGARVHAVVATHAHHDHVASAAAVVEIYDVPFHLHPADQRLLLRANFLRKLIDLETIQIPHVDRDLAGGTTLTFGALSVDVTHTPGHTPGGVCLASSGQLFTGDTVTADQVGRTDLPGGDRDALGRSVALLGERYPPTATVLPGHGPSAQLGDVLARVSKLPELQG